MLALWLLAAHLVGDFVLQTRWQADGKFGWTRRALVLRTSHVAAYALAFAPVLSWRIACHGLGPGRAAAFLGALLACHWLTDSRRFDSTAGDVVGWRLRHDDPTPPNPWPLLPLAIDQTLHVAQLAALGLLL